jgi:hypothetical protein
VLEDVFRGVAEEPRATTRLGSKHDQIGLLRLDLRNDRLAGTPCPYHAPSNANAVRPCDRPRLLNQTPRLRFLFEHVRFERKLGRELNHDYRDDRRALLRR